MALTGWNNAIIEGVNAPDGRFHQIVGRIKRRGTDYWEFTQIDADQINARSASGLKLYDDAGNGIFIADGGVANLAKSIVLAASALGTQTAGALEFTNDRFYITNVGTRRAIDRTSGIITSTATVSSTASETTIFTGTLGADDMKAGNHIDMTVSGILSNETASDDITINVYMGSTLVGTYKPSIGNVTGADWHLSQEITIRSVGATGSIAFHGHTEINGNTDTNNSIETIDTTAAEDLTVKVQWDNSKAGNTISAYQGQMSWRG